MHKLNEALSIPGWHRTHLTKEGGTENLFSLVTFSNPLCAFRIVLALSENASAR